MILILPILFPWFYKARETKKDTSSDIIRLGDKCFIHNNEFIDLNENTPLKIFQQQQEDSALLHDYRMYCLTYWSDKYSFMLTIKLGELIRQKPELLENVTGADIRDHILSYQEYLLICNFINSIFIMSLEEYIIYRQNLASLFVPIHMMMWYPKKGYTIYNSDTAKYKKGNLQELLHDELIEEIKLKS